MVKVLIFLCGVLSLDYGNSLPDKYLIRYGNPKAKVTVTEYFSFGCSACIQMFKDDFDYFRKKYIETGKVQWVFHPYPVDLVTVQGLACLECIEKKKVFFEAIFLEKNNHTDMLGLMENASNLLGARVPNLRCSRVLQSTDAFKNAYIFLQAKQDFSGLPTVRINGKVIDDMPSRQLIEKHIKEIIQ